MTSAHQTPGVYRQDVFLAPTAELRTGVPAFLGFCPEGPVSSPQPLTLWLQFGATFGPLLPGGYLGHAVRGFFENGGQLCYVVRLDQAAAPDEALDQGLAAAASLEDVDLVAAPDAMRPREGVTLAPDPELTARMQAAVVRHCDELGDRLAILDGRPGAGVSEVLEQRARLTGTNATLYHPWVMVADGPATTGGFVPPCGHVAGLYARTDRAAGVHKAPANEVMAGVLDLEIDLTASQQAILNPAGVNCLRAFPGRGIRVWGARTLALDPAWTYVNARRLFLTVGRWLEREMAVAAFEPSGPQLWARIGRELTGYLDDLFRRGALRGRTAQEAFYVKCDAETNTPDVRATGMVATEIGLASAVPSEFVVVRIIHGATGVAIASPS